MNSFELSKIFGPVFVAIIFIMGMTDITGAIFSSKSKEPGYVIEVAEASTSSDEEEAIDTAIGMIASADIGKGENVAKKCSACHSFDNGGANKVGPNLWNTVNRPLASVEGAKYSAALTAKADEIAGWDYASLSAFLTKPKNFVKGTSMGFAGLKKPEDRAAIIAYLRSQSDAPAPLPAE